MSDKEPKLASETDVDLHKFANLAACFSKICNGEPVQEIILALVYTLENVYRNCYDKVEPIEIFVDKVKKQIIIFNEALNKNK